MLTVMRQFLEQISSIVGPLKESIRDFISMKVLKRVSVRVGRGLLYFSYRQYRKSGLRLFVGIRGVEGTRFQELSIGSIIRLRDAVSEFMRDAKTNVSLDRENDTDEINVPFTNGNLVRLRRDNTLYPWLKENGENVASQGKRLPLWINLEGSGVDGFEEIPMAAATLIVNALDGFLSLAGVPMPQK